LIIKKITESDKVCWLQVLSVKDTFKKEAGEKKN